MSKNSSYIDGLRTRSEKKGDFSGSTKKVRVGYTSYETGDPLAMSRNRKRNLGSTIDHAVFNKTERNPKTVKTAKTENIANKIETIAKTVKNDTFTRVESKRVALNKPKSYNRDVLGIDDDSDFEFDYDDIRKPKKEKKHKKDKKKNFFLKHKIFSLILIIVVVLGGIGYFWGDSIISKITGGRGGLFDLLRTIVSDDNTTLKSGADGRTNILVFGTSGYDMAGDEGNGVHDGAQLTDSIMVISVDVANNDVAMISLPRDLKTTTCTATSKINELYYCSNKDGKNEESGANALRNRVSSMLGIEIQYYAHINWSSLIQIVDAIGGITVTVDEDIDDEGWTNVKIKKGVPTMMNGEQALGLARARHGTDNGDFTRGNSQQKILIAIKDKISSMKLDLGGIINLANILGDNLRTDFSVGEMKAAAKTFTENDINKMRQIPLYGGENNFITTGYINGISYAYPLAGASNYNVIKNHIKQSLTTDPLILENAKVLVLNGSGVTGLAAKEAEELKGAGFSIINTGNAPSGDYFEKLYVYNVTNKTATAEKIKKYYNTNLLDVSTMPSGIDMNGVDFVVILGVGYSIE